MKKLREARLKILYKSGIIPIGSSKQKMILPNPDIDYLKSPMMRVIEKWSGIPIEHTLLANSESKVAATIGTDKSTVSKWITRLSLRYTKDHLPSCDRCLRRRSSCQVGSCAILADMKMVELQEYKKQDITVRQLAQQFRDRGLEP